MDSQGSSVFVYLFLALLVLSVVLIIWMFVSLVRSELEDERRKLIVGKACTWTLIATVGANLIEVIEVAVQQPNGEPVSPFIRLVVTALMYAIFLGFSQEDLARRCGVSRQTINAIENNKYDPTLSLAFHLARELGVTVDGLFTPGE